MLLLGHRVGRSGQRRLVRSFAPLTFVVMPNHKESAGGLLVRVCVLLRVTLRARFLGSRETKSIDFCEHDFLLLCELYL